MNKDSLGDRMKQYENVPKNQLMRRQPVIIRIDGKAFHTLLAVFNVHLMIFLLSLCKRQ